MSKQKKPRQKAYSPAKHTQRVPPYLRNLPAGRQRVHFLIESSQERLLRCYFKTATLSDLNGLFTNLCLTEELAKNMAEADVLRKELSHGKEILRNTVLNRDMTKADFDRLSEIVDLMAEIWSHSSVDEIKRLHAIINTPEFGADTLLPGSLDELVNPEQRVFVEEAK